MGFNNKMVSFIFKLPQKAFLQCAAQWTVTCKELKTLHHWCWRVDGTKFYIWDDQNVTLFGTWDTCFIQSSM